MEAGSLGGDAPEGAGSPPPLLEARELSKRFGDVVALDRVDFEVRSGETVALVGESGSGKTTLLRSFNRMVEPDSGVVRVRGVDVGEQDPIRLRRSLGYVQQDGGLLPHWTIERNVALVPWMRGDRDAPERAGEALERVGLPPASFGARYPGELSGGQRQRAAFARALAGGADVLLLDEPFGALDALSRADLQDVFGALRRELGVASLLVTHDLQEAFRLADRVAVMRSGRVEQCASPEVLLATPATAYVEALLRRARVSTEGSP